MSHGWLKKAHIFFVLVLSLKRTLSLSFHFRLFLRASVHALGRSSGNQRRGLGKRQKLAAGLLAAGAAPKAHPRRPPPPQLQGTTLTRMYTCTGERASEV